MTLLAHLEIEVSWQPERIDCPRALILMGNLRLPELRAELLFGSHDGHGGGNGNDEEHRATATMIPYGFKMATQPRHLSLPAHEETDVWALIPAAALDPPWVERYAGRLGAESLTFDRYVTVDMSLDVVFAPEELDNGRVAKVHVAGELRFERSVCMRLLFRDPKHSMAPPSVSSANELKLIVGETRVAIPRQTVSRPADRGASMSVRVVEAGGRVVCVEQALRPVAPP